MTSVSKTLERVYDKVRWLAGKSRSWEVVEHFDEGWKKRIAEMARFIALGESVTDLGCGPMWLEPLLKDNAYYPVDYTPRDHRTEVADFNKHEFPPRLVDVAFVSGTLEYVEDYAWFIEQVSRHATRCILSYCTTECFPDLSTRKGKAWANHLSRSAVVELFAINGMDLEAESTSVPLNSIFVFSRRGNPKKQEDGQDLSSDFTANAAPSS
jgi:hypothetical protein